MLANKGCYSEEELMKCSFMKLIKLTLKDILNSEISTADKYWFVCNTKVLTIKEKKQLDDKYKEFVIDYYKKNYPHKVEWIKGYIARYEVFHLVFCLCSFSWSPGGLQVLKDFCSK